MAVSSAVAGALSSGVVALMISRVGSLLVDAVDTKKLIHAGLHRSICIVSAVAGSLMIGFNGFMWSQAVIVEVYTLSVLSLVSSFLLLSPSLRSRPARSDLYCILHVLYCSSQCKLS